MRATIGGRPLTWAEKVALFRYVRGEQVESPESWERRIELEQDPSRRASLVRGCERDAEEVDAVAVAFVGIVARIFGDAVPSIEYEGGTPVDPATAGMWGQILRGPMNPKGWHGAPPRLNTPSEVAAA